jgi:hypothetical protein
VRAAKWFIFCVVFFQSSFVFYSFLFRSLCCVCFLDKRLFDYPIGIFKLFLYILLNISNYCIINLITYFYWGLGSWPWSHGSWIYNYLRNRWRSPLMLWVWIPLRARCTALCNKVCQWLATGWLFSPGPPVSSTYKAYRHGIVESGVKHHKKTPKR